MWRALDFFYFKVSGGRTKYVCIQTLRLSPPVNKEMSRCNHGSINSLIDDFPLVNHSLHLVEHFQRMWKYT